MISVSRGRAPVQVMRRLLARRADVAWDASWPVVALVLLAVTTIHVVVAWGASYPTNSLDEIVMVGYSRAIAGVDPGWQLSGSGYMPGLAILMAPAWWFTQDPATVYQGGIAITVALAMAAIWPLALLARRAGLTVRTAIVTAAVPTIAPAPALMSNYLASESLLLLATATSLVLADRLVRVRTIGAGILLGSAASVAFLAHGRALALGVAVAIWVVWVFRHEVRIAAATLGALLLGSGLAYLLYRAVSAQVLLDDSRTSTTVSELSNGSVQGSIGALVGQLWYPTIAFPAVVVVAVLFLARKARTDSLATLILLATAGSLALAVLQLKPAASLRLDTWFYGRYNEQLWVVLAVIGAAVLVRVVWPGLVALVVAVSAALGVGFLAITVPQMSVTQYWVDMHVFGVAPWLSTERYGNGEMQNWGTIVGVGLLLTVAVGVLSLVRSAVVPGLLVIWAAITLGYDAMSPALRSDARSSDDTPLPQEILNSGEVLWLDPGSGTEGNSVVFGARDLVVSVSAYDDLPEDVAVYIAPFSVQDPADVGGLLWGDGAQGLLNLWVFPGPLQDDLLRQGLVAEPVPLGG
ncbi:hypothetical protein [Demequina zhanjiangensis]|uniref:4-amino-4-deoxy-L-arabinose transferase n=1 Tax=Demequina zhanjiangensis TaxID=3051659 RepID=A0ABT8G2H3_9MICO|nr:hypothetical protein [Demequina sp. SYSU T00b26]MDN4473342.1 hypothetical protein [Demequina sp. SYSU T00b26]